MSGSALWRALELRERSSARTAQSLRSRSMPLAAKLMTLRPSPAHAPTRMAALVSLILWLTSAPQLYAQRRMATASLVVQVRPEEQLQSQNGSVVLKIRLARGTTARLWAADTCASSSQATHVITLSGTYSIPWSGFTPVSNNPSSSAMRVCLASSDGALNDSLPVEFLGPRYGATAPGATPQITTPSSDSFDLPDGWVETTQAGTTTWSNP